MELPLQLGGQIELAVAAVVAEAVIVAMQVFHTAVVQELWDVAVVLLRSASSNT